VPSPSVRHPWTLKDLKNGGKRVFLINVNIKICLLVDSRVEAPRYKSSLQAATFYLIELSPFEMSPSGQVSFLSIDVLAIIDVVACHYLNIDDFTFKSQS
jgi:hypothetical protein